jgi:hypothetical protein
VEDHDPGDEEQEELERRTGTPPAEEAPDDGPSKNV